MPLKISIIIPSFNQGKYIEETILSVLNQNDPFCELIVIDGGSTDRSVDVIKKYEKKLTYWISEKDRGQSDAINKGFRFATGDIITWLGSDDLLLEGSLARVRSEFESSSEKTGVIFGPSQIFSAGVDLHIEYGSRIQNIERRLAGMAFPQPSSFIKRKFVDLAGELNLDLHYGMDYDLFARLSLLCDFKRVDFCFSRYRIHDESKSGGDFENFNIEWVKIFNSVALGLNLEDALIRMKSLKLIMEPLPATLDYFRQHKNVVKLDEELLTFFFISNVFFHSYLTGRFKRARFLASYLNDNYSAKMKLLPDLSLIYNRSLKIPPFALRAARSVKYLFSAK